MEWQAFYLSGALYALNLFVWFVGVVAPLASAGMHA